MNYSLTVELKKRVMELGFAAVGIAPAQHLKLAEDAINERVMSGYLRDYGFAWKPAEAFTHPESLLPGARTMIAAAWGYRTEDGFETGGPVARFARGRDYHAIVMERLEEIGKWLVNETGAGYRICVDIGPMIDRAAAQAAGIGSYGKNCSIITKQAGSWVVIGEIVTDVELIYDAPAPLEECGECSLCMEACPAGAIVSPFIIDQTKCISHLTQMKGIIPAELRPLIGGRIYGCDTCQEVCPKNHCLKKQESVREEPWNINLKSLPSLLNISQEDFDRLIGPTAVAWIGCSRFRRNVAVALGNVGGPEAVPDLIKALDDPDPIIREHASWALMRVRDRLGIRQS